MFDRQSGPLVVCSRAVAALQYHRQAGCYSCRNRDGERTTSTFRDQKVEHERRLDAASQTTDLSSLHNSPSTRDLHSDRAVAWKSNMDSLIPSSFLPHLPRQQNTLSPLTAITVLSHVSLLRELYIPPIHGGFNINDLNTVSGYGSDEDGESSHQRQRSSDKVKARKRRFSASLADTMDGLGLGLDVNEGIGAHGGLDAAATIQEEDGSELEDEDEIIEEGGEPAAHLDPFEREWAEKWLNGVVRRAQGWSEEHEEVEGEVEKGAEEFSHKDIEAILRDATAVLAMMAGTSGESTSCSGPEVGLH